VTSLEKLIQDLEDSKKIVTENVGVSVPGRDDLNITIFNKTQLRFVTVALQAAINRLKALNEELEKLGE